MRFVGRLLQLLGLSLPILAIFLQITDQLTLGRMLVATVAALCLFYIGRIIEGYAQR